MFVGGKNNEERGGQIPGHHNLCEVLMMGDEFPVRDERVLQWSLQETRDLIGIRGDLERGFSVAKRNKSLWEVVAVKMSERGYRRTPDQCKCKWKNLVNRYKGDEIPVRDERMLPWSMLETRDLIGIKGDLEREFSVAKRNKLWEVVAEKISERGYMRTPDQCKCKWKNLVNRYKGKETSDPDSGRQIPFFHEMHQVFTERENNMQRLLLESESGSAQSKKRVKILSGYQSSEELSEDENNNDEYESHEERVPQGANPRKRKAEKEKQPSKQPSPSSISTIQEMLKDFIQQQQRIEMQWMESMEKRAHERRLFEQEWRQYMEKMERERMMMEQAWREREEQRRMREESRAEKRDALLTTLLNKLIRENQL